MNSAIAIPSKLQVDKKTYLLSKFEVFLKTAMEGKAFFYILFELILKISNLAIICFFKDF